LPWPVARSSKNFELRAAVSLSQLWQQQGKHTEARELLTPIYGWFTEGFDTADLQEAKALLEALAGLGSSILERRSAREGIEVLPWGSQPGLDSIHGDCFDTQDCLPEAFRRDAFIALFFQLRECCHGRLLVADGGHHGPPDPMKHVGKPGIADRDAPFCHASQYGHRPIFIQLFRGVLANELGPFLRRDRFQLQV
jgi:hypothetical protein